MAGVGLKTGRSTGGTPPAAGDHCADGCGDGLAQRHRAAVEGADMTTTVLTLTLTGLAADSRAAGGGNPSWGRRLGQSPPSGIGTLAIHTVKTKTGAVKYNNGISRWVARDLTDSVQTQVVRDVQQLYDKDWVRRQLWDRNYSGRAYPVPYVLLELLSHQNFPDMRYGLDPRFRFTANRAMYKGICVIWPVPIKLHEYKVQPLPVEAFCADFTDSTEVELRWKPVDDT